MGLIFRYVTTESAYDHHPGTTITVAKRSQAAALTHGAVIPFAAHVTAIRRNQTETIMGRSKMETAAIAWREVVTETEPGTRSAYPNPMRFGA